MSHSTKLLPFVMLAPALLCAQLVPEQRRQDFIQLASLVAKRYAPYEWKRDALGFDAYDARPWVARAAAAQSDLEFYEICAEYIASLRDLHSGFYLPSDFNAYIGIGVDLYDGVARIDTIDRFSLPATQYPFEVGDEVVAVDGVTAADWISRVSRLQSFANPRATSRWALDQWFNRYQDVLPRAVEVGATAEVRIRKRTTGEENIYLLPWETSGVPRKNIGPVPPLRLSEDAGPALPPAVARLWNRSAPVRKRLRGFGTLAPVFALPAGFAYRLGRFPGDRFVSGSYTADGRRIGFLRIPTFSFSFAQQNNFLAQLGVEINWLQQNTDALVIDVMRNPGGDVCFTNEILRRLIPYPFDTIGDELRPTLDLIAEFRLALEDAQFGPPVVSAMLQALVRDLETAYSENRGRTGSFNVCGGTLTLTPFADTRGNLVVYTKPILVLMDEFSTSSADVFPALLQDAGRATLFGQATAGGGGLSVFKETGMFSEASASVSVSLGTRPREVQAPGLPPTRYIENVGARPDIEADYMRLDNLLNNGRPFVDSFTQAVLRLIP